MKLKVKTYVVNLQIEILALYLVKLSNHYLFFEQPKKQLLKPADIFYVSKNPDAGYCLQEQITVREKKY